jgi:hypothetical protein
MLSSGAVSADPAVNINNIPDEIVLAHVIPKIGVSDRLVLSCVDRRTRALVDRDAGDDDLVLRVSDFFNTVTRLCWSRENGTVPLGRVDLRCCSIQRTARGAAVGPRERVSLERGDLCPSGI